MSGNSLRCHSRGDVRNHYASGSDDGPCTNMTTGDCDRSYADKAFIIDLYVACQANSWPNMRATANDTVVIDCCPSVNDDVIANNHIGVNHSSGSNDYSDAQLY